jgi:hypothetical protein
LPTEPAGVGTPISTPTSALRPFAAIDWSRPWLATVRDAAAAVARQLGEDAGSHWRAALDAGAGARDVRSSTGLPLQFVAQDCLPPGVAYETFVAGQGRVPTRDNLHDYFNGLVWLSFPQTKRQLNAMQAQHIAQAGIGSVRGPVRDAITIFDENAAILAVTDDACGAALLAALRAHDWQHAFALWRREGAAGGRRFAELYLFGHALMEKLVAPYKAITAHVLALPVTADFFALAAPARLAALDSALARQLEGDGFYRGCLTPLPVLGVPGWWPQQDRAFYADASVFRPKRAGTVK